MKLILIFSFIAIAICDDNAETDGGHRVTHEMWFQIKIGNKTLPERMVFGLFGKVVPMTVENFVTLAQRPKGEGFKGSKLHFSNKNEFIAGGEWVLVGRGTEGRSCFDNPTFDEENLKIKNYGAGWICSDPNTVNDHHSRFIITLKRVSRLDNSCVVFGKVISGMPIVKKIARLPTKGVILAVDVIISDCGAEFADPPFFVPKNDAVD